MKKERSYPWVGVGTSGVIVKFESPNTGVVLKDNGPHHKKGYDSNLWAESKFRPCRIQDIKDKD